MELLYLTFIQYFLRKADILRCYKWSWKILRYFPKRSIRVNILFVYMTNMELNLNEENRAPSVELRQDYQEGAWGKVDGNLNSETAKGGRTHKPDFNRTSALQRHESLKYSTPCSDDNNQYYPSIAAITPAERRGYQDDVKIKNVGPHDPPRNNLGTRDTGWHTRRRNYTWEELAPMLPKTKESQSKAKKLYTCRHENCTKTTTEETLGYCGDHFTELYNNNIIERIPNDEDISAFRRDMQLLQQARTNPSVRSQGLTTPISHPVRHKQSYDDQYYKHTGAVGRDPYPGAADRWPYPDHTGGYAYSGAGDVYSHETGEYSRKRPDIPLDRPHVKRHISEGINERAYYPPSQHGSAYESTARDIHFATRQSETTGNSDLEESGQSDEESYSQPSPTQHSAGDKQPKCIRCDNKGDKSYNGLCSQCYNQIVRQKFANMPAPRPDYQTSKHGHSFPGVLAHRRDKPEPFKPFTHPTNVGDEAMPEESPEAEEHEPFNRNSRSRFSNYSNASVRSSREFVGTAAARETHRTESPTQYSIPVRPSDSDQGPPIYISPFRDEHLPHTWHEHLPVSRNNLSSLTSRHEEQLIHHAYTPNVESENRDVSMTTQSTARSRIPASSSTADISLCSDVSVHFPPGKS